MTIEQAKSELMQIYGALSPDKQRAIDTLVKIAPKTGHWTPVSERLPKKYTYTLWCASSGYVRSDYFNGEVWEDAKKLGYEVIAWMPLPKPYEPQERIGEE